jgi:hypothetical protein
MATGPLLELVQGTNQSYDLTVTDQDGDPEDLTTDKVEFLLRFDPTNPQNPIYKSTDSPLDINRLGGNQARLFFVPSDTSGLVRQGYFYQVRITRADASVFTAIDWSPAVVTLGGDTVVPPPPVFPNTVKLDHNYELPDALRYMTPGGSPIAGAQVRVYLQADYTAGRLANPIGTTITDARGRWVNPILVSPGFTYVVQFFQPNTYGPDTATAVT